MKAKRLLSSILSVAMLVSVLCSCLTADVFATTWNFEDTNSILNGEFESEIPESSDTLFEDRVTVTASYSPELMFATSWMSESEAAATLRENMKNRVTSFTLDFRSAVGPDEVFYTVLDSAVIHTGKPDEGDFINWQYSNIRASFDYYSSGGVYFYSMSYTVTYFTTKAQEDKVDAAVDSVLKQLNVYDKSDYEKIVAIYDYICSTVTYDYDNLGDDSYLLKHSAYAAFIDKTAVCQGYALMFYRLALELGVDNRIITGTSHGERHAWNIVKLDGKYYNLDSTWDAGAYSYNYFLKSAGNFTDHQRDAEFLTADFSRRYPIATEDHSSVLFTIIDGVLVSYNGTGQSNVTVPNNVTAIGPYAFVGCSDVVSIVIPESVTSIGEAAFGLCTSLETVNIPAGVTAIPDAAFRYDVSLKNITLPSGVTSIGTSAFEGCESLETINLPEGLKTIGEAAFCLCLSLSDITLPSTLTEMQDMAFAGCCSLTKIVIPEGITVLNDLVFSSCIGLTSVTLPSRLTVIGEDAFSYCDNLQSIEIPEGVTEIKNQAFAYTSSLTEIIIPSSVTTIGMNAFNGSLDKITFLNPETQIADYSGTINQSAVIYGYTISTARDYAKEYNRLFVALDPDTEIPLIASGTCGENLVWKLDEDYVLTISGTGAMTSSPWLNDYDDYITTVIIEEGITSICNGAFEYSNVKRVTLPSTLTHIGDKAFYYCDNLEEVDLQIGLVSIGDSAFSCCLRLESIVIPDSVTSIGSNAFGNSYNLDTVVLPEGLTEIPFSMFAGCSELSSVNIPESVTSIGDYAFKSCIRLSSIELPDGVTSIGNSAFLQCSSLESIVLPDGITSIPDYAFQYCSKLKSVTIPQGVTSINYMAFYDCYALTSITIPESVTSIGTFAFSSCNNLSKIYIYSSDVEIKDNSETFPSNAVIYGYADSTAQAYAEKYNRTFIALVEGGVLGDIDRNGSINNNDAIYLLYATIFGEESYPLNQDCDFDDNGVVNNNDAIYLLYHTIFGAEQYPLN